MAPHRLTLCAIALVACGTPKPPASWIERDSHAQPHATRSGSAATSVAAFDLTNPDALDEAMIAVALEQLGDRAPAGALALRAA
ncbi:MAG: hypothetical protein H0T79_23530, partial [Deltaproteobacteria bacterium]|nr:hypothetical protein [Deltaproteobacteria bacterium]